jgi:hypothetical protein
MPEPYPLCAGEDPALWQPDEGVYSKKAEKVAKDICQECDIRNQCLATALQNEGALTSRWRFGIWGGMTPAERYRLYKASTQSRQQRPPPPNPRNLTEEEEQKRLALYHAGMDDDQMAAECDCDRAAIRSWRHRRKLPAHRPETSNAQYWHLYHLGWESWEVCEARGIKMVTFQRWLQRNGLKPNPPRQQVAV